MSYSKSPQEQKMITRQSQIKLALDFYKNCGYCPTITDLIRTTEYLTIYIEKGMDMTEDGVSRTLPIFEKLDDYIHKNYKG